MAVSRKRKGHNKRIQKRKVQLKSAQSAMQKLMNDAMKTQIDEMKKKMEEESGSTQTNETTEIIPTQPE